ncbi:UDP-glycosyltransferase 79B30 isoform X2 [Cajanus cajan]|uniref:UDP-glycosyltransferase 79B30 isoform X2 n=1 Tax=Cajanus cajan TaxID=3821 RepID=UPI0010FB851F|nr:UDP-glycosyltransferase 79B30 isoform X2 [Cajanus cajan]
MDAPSLHIAIFPWFAMGHLTPNLHLSNKLAKRGHRISFFIPKTTQTKLQHLNHHPHLITFFPITVPRVDGLPHDAETTSDLPFSLFPLLATAMDRTEKEIEHLLRKLKPQIVFFDFQHWIPNLTRSLGIKCMHYFIANPLSIAYLWNGPRQTQGGELTEADLMKPPKGFPDSSIKLHAHEVRFLAATRKLEFGSGVLLYDRLGIGASLADAIGFKALKHPNGFESVEEALPQGFRERVQGRGIAYGGWVQQQLILEHPSVGCFITHCGAASVTEALVNTCQLVLLPRLGADHVMNARMLSRKLKVGVEVEKDEEGLFTKESVCEAVNTVMDDGNELGREVRENHVKLRNFLLSDNLESSCVDSFCQGLHDLL